MNLKGKVIQDWRIAAVGAGAATVLGLLGLTPLGEPISNLSYQLPFHFRSNIQPEDVTILYMDDESHKYLRQPLRQQWDRSVHARTLERLTQLGAKAVVFDVLFDEPTTEAQDNLLVQAAQRHGNVVFAAMIQADIVGGTVVGAKIKSPFSNLLRWGVSETAEADRFVRQHHRDNAFNAPSLAWTAAQATMSEPLSEPSRARWINYYGPPGIIPFFSYYQVLSNTIPVEAISNKVVFVGALYSVGFTGGLGTDDFRTPYTHWAGTKSPGVEVSATAYLNLVRRDWLTELPRIYELLLVLLFALLFGFGLTWFRPMPAATLAVVSSLAIAAAAILLVWLKLIWFPWLVPSAVQVPAALCWSVLLHTKQLRREKEALEMQLAAAHLCLPSRESESELALTIQAKSTGPDASAPQGQRLSTSGPIPVRVVGSGEGSAPPIPDHTLVRSIGKGAYGEVWLAKDVIGTYHGVKVIYRKNFKDAAPFEREFRGIQKFTPISRSHAGFVNILHVGRNDEAGYFYYIMELGDDETAGQRIDPATYSPKNLASLLRAQGKLPPPECLEIALNLAAALHHLHQQQLIHRDIKPSNIIFVNGAPKFADIGLVTEIGKAGRDVTYIGTEGYIAPEGPGTAAADVYSLGKVIYELCTGLDRERFPELPTTLAQEMPENPIVLRMNKIILKACETDVRKRYQSAGELHGDLRGLQPAVASS